MLIHMFASLPDDQIDLATHARRSRHMPIRTALAVLIVVSSISAHAECPKVPDRKPQVVYETDSPISHAIPFARLLASPEKYDGQRVLLYGVFGDEIGGLSIYSDLDSMKHSVILNGVFINATQAQELIICRQLGSWGLIQGTFHAIRGDVAPGFVGELDNVSRIRPRPRRDQ